MTLLDRSICMIPHQGIGSPLSSLFLISLFGGAQGREWKEAYIAKSKTGPNKENRSYNQIKMCMCVEFFGWNLHSLLHDSIFFYLGIWAIFLFSFFLCFWTRIFFLLLFFHIAHILFAIWRVISKWWNIFVWMEGMFLRNFQCRSQHMSSWVVKSRQTNSDAPES